MSVVRQKKTILIHSYKVSFIFKNILEHLKNRIKIEKDNYELSKLDREKGEQNLNVLKSDLVHYLKNKRNEGGENE